MIPTRHRVLRAALLLVPAVVVAGLLGVHHLGVVSAQTPPTSSRCASRSTSLPPSAALCTQVAYDRRTGRVPQPR